MIPTPTSHGSLTQRLGNFETLTEGLDYAARGTTGCNFYAPRGHLETVLGYAELQARSHEAALRLSALGLERGARVAILAETTPDFMAFFYGCQYAGLVPVPLPLSINLGGHEAYVQRLRAMLNAAKVSAAIASDELIALLREAGTGVVAGMIGTPADFLGLGTRGGELRPLTKDEPCYMQYSSGSTSLPRGVLVSQRAITNNARGIARDGLRLVPEDRATSWLPLYHDMGLVGFCISPMMSQVSIDYMATSAFARRPLLWLKLISEAQSTIAFSPTFGYELCVRRVTNGQASQYDLSSWRIAGIGGEMVRPEVLQEFTDCFAPSGFDGKAFLPSYGLAESTLAVTFPRLGSGVRVDHIDRTAYESRAEAIASKAKTSSSAYKARAFVFCGSALPGHEVEVRGSTGQALADRKIGRVCVRGPSVMQGYYDDSEASEAVMLADGWMDTGDLGYLVEGELVITGRSKDLIICNGRNIWPQDLEWTVEKLPGIRPGCVAAFSVDQERDSEQVVVIAETRLSEEQEQQLLVQDILFNIRRTAGVDCQAILVPPRSLTFTSSGKLSRAAVREDFLSGALRPLTEDAPIAGFADSDPRLMATAN